MKIKIIALILVFPLFTNCTKEKLCKDDNLSIQKVEYTGRGLRIDGYFIEKKESSEKYTELRFLYRNGIVLGFTDFNNENNTSENLDVSMINKSLKSKAAWGALQVSGNIIQIDRWSPSASGCFNTLYESGNILNDTTFIITKREYRENGSTIKIETPNSTFYFRQLTQKPDSTNNFIK